MKRPLARGRTALLVPRGGQRGMDRGRKAWPLAHKNSQEERAMESRRFEHGHRGTLEKERRRSQKLGRRSGGQKYRDNLKRKSTFWGRCLYVILFPRKVSCETSQLIPREDLVENFGLTARCP